MIIMEQGHEAGQHAPHRHDDGKEDGRSGSDEQHIRWRLADDVTHYDFHQ